MKRSYTLLATLGLSTVFALPLTAVAQVQQDQTIVQPGATYAPGSAMSTGADFAGGVVGPRGVTAVKPQPPSQGGYQQYQGGRVTSQGVVNNASGAQGQ